MNRYIALMFGIMMISMYGCGAEDGVMNDRERIGAVSEPLTAHLTTTDAATYCRLHGQTLKFFGARNITTAYYDPPAIVIDALAGYLVGTSPQVYPNKRAVVQSAKYDALAVDGVLSDSMIDVADLIKVDWSGVDAWNFNATIKTAGAVLTPPGSMLYVESANGNGWYLAEKQ